VPSSASPLPSQLDARLRALAHQARRDLVAACLDRPLPAGQLVDLLDLAPASVSEHLKILRKTGLLVLDRRGRFRYYRADATVVRTTAALEALALPQKQGDPSRLPGHVGQ
jgi:DNA-binding transcriptional ArsR family regulator